MSTTTVSEKQAMNAYEIRAHVDTFDSDLGIFVRETIERLARFTEYGPGYSRNVTAALSDARLFMDRGQFDAALRFAYMAQMRAGEMTFEQYQALGY